MLVEIKFSLTLVGALFKSILNMVPIMLNYAKRPKANIRIKNHNIIIAGDAYSKERHVCYPSILISFEKDVKIDISSIKINDVKFCGLLSRDPNFLNQKANSKNKVIIKNNKIMPFVSKNWSKLTQQTCLYDIKSLEQEVLPLYIHKNSSEFIFNPKKNTHLLFPKRKISLSMNINGKNYEYGISLLDFCKLVINNLAFNI